MRKLLQVDFTLPNTMGPEVINKMVELAKSINLEPGLVWKIWTQQPVNQLGGGIYLFEDEQSAKSYLEMHSNRLTQMGITNIRGVIFNINSDLTHINQGPIS